MFTGQQKISGTVSRGFRDKIPARWQKTLMPFLACFFFISSFFILFYRLQFGVDFFDEAFYSALCMRWYTGQIPFRDEYFLASTFSVFSYPLFKIFLNTTGSIEGIILYLRLCFGGSLILLALFVFSYLKKYFYWPVALLVAACSCLFFPFNLVTFSYNTLGTLFLTLSLFCLWRGILFQRHYLTILAGIFLGFSVVAYVTYLILAVFLCFYVFFRAPQRRDGICFGTGLIISLIIPSFFVFMHRGDFLDAIRFSKEYSYTTSKIFQIYSVTRKLFPKQVLFPVLIFLGLVKLIKQRKSKFFWTLVFLLPLIALALSHLSTSYFAVYSVYFCLLAFLLLCNNSKTSEEVGLWTWVFVPSCVAGIISSSTSATGALNAQVGLMPAFLVSLLFMGNFLFTHTTIPRCLIPFPMAMPIFFLLFYPLNIWSDVSLAELTDRVQIGPYKGILTHSEKRKIAEETFKTLSLPLKGKGPLLIFPNFSAGYLITPISPARGVTWYQNSGRTNEILASLYKSQLSPSSRVLRMKIYYGTPTMKTYPSFSKRDPLNGYIEATHEVELETEWFTLWRPR